MNGELGPANVIYAFDSLDSSTTQQHELTDGDALREKEIRHHLARIIGD